MEERIIDELNNLIANPDSSTFALLNKAIQLATINNDKFYEPLFQYHVKGLNKADTERLAETNPDLLSMFSADRMKTGETFYLTGSISYLESSLKQYEEDIKSAFSDLERIKADEPLYPTTMHQVKRSSASSLIGALRTNESKVRDVILKIRSRVALFTNQEEIKLLKQRNSKSNGMIMRNKIFIGHGHSQVWKELKDFLQDRLSLDWDEFNRESTAGIAIKERLEDMLQSASFAFLIMTAEDEHADETLHARENVVHEIGLFQGKLGFRKAIVLLEEGCQEFSNIIGVGQIRFSSGNIKAEFEEIRRVLEREEILANKT